MRLCEDRFSCVEARCMRIPDLKDQTTHPQSDQQLYSLSGTYFLHAKFGPVHTSTFGFAPIESVGETGAK